MDLQLELWLERFSEWMRLRNWSHHTIGGYQVGVRLFFRYLDNQGVVSLATVTQELVEGFRTELFYRRHHGKPLSVGTQVQRLQAVKTFLRYLVRENYLLVDVSSTVDLPKRPETLPLVLSEDQTVCLLEAPDVSEPLGIRDRAVLEVLYASALRNAELGGLGLDDIDRDRQTLWVREGKGQKSRLVPLGDEAMAWLEEYLLRVRPRLLADSQETHIFLGQKGQPFVRKTLLRIVQRYALQVGLKGVHPHTLRHSCATHMLARGAGLRHIQVLLGHGSPVTTGHYTKVEISDLQKVLRRCHPRERRWGMK